MSVERIFNAVKTYAYEKIEKRLPNGIYYHDLDHTKEVLAAVEFISGVEGITPEDLFLVKTAAVFHDIGFIFQYKDNEEIAAREIKKILSGFGYSKAQIGRIEKIILATKMEDFGGVLKQVPEENDFLQKIMCDSDLSYLGTDEFFLKSDLLRIEKHIHGKIKKSKEEWDKENLVFLKNHEYFTNGCRLWRDEGKKKNLEILESRIKNLH